MANSGKADDMKTVGEIIRDAMDENNLSSRDVDRLTEEAGHRVAYSTVARIAKGTYQPSIAQLRALAKALRIRLTILKDAAGVEDTGDPFVLPEYANKLSIAERDAVRNIIRLLAQSKDERKTDDADDERPPGRFEVIDADAEFRDIAARNWREGDPGVDDDGMLDDA